MYRNEKGLGIISLILIIIVIIAVVIGGIYLAQKLLTKNEIEDIKVNVSKMEAKADAIQKLYNLDTKKNPLLGIAIKKTEEGKYAATEGEYIFSEEFQNALATHDSTEKGKEAKYYIWNKEHLATQEIYIETDSKKFYVVNYTTIEVFYSEGYEGKYTFNDLKTIEE